MRIPIVILVLVNFLMGCSSEETDAIENDLPENSLAETIEGREIALSSVIACAGSAEDTSAVRVYLYPRPQATDIRYFETPNANIDPNNFDNYYELQPPRQGLFNNFLQFFEVSPDTEKWAIITFEEAGTLNVSNPIRLKHRTRPTEYLPENVSVTNAIQELNPQFSWVDGTLEDTIIYFQVVSTEQGDLLSGTYTLDRNFQFYVLDNVVLNITEEAPPDLELGVGYRFTLLAVSEDNWVNLFSEISFRL